MNIVCSIFLLISSIITAGQGVIERYGLIGAQAPYIGQYDPSKYHFFSHSLIAIDVNHLITYAPSNLKTLIKNVPAYTQVVIHTPTTKIKLDQPLNLVFHPFTAIKQNPTNNPTIGFNINIKAGIFDIHGVKVGAIPSAIAVNQLSPLNINTHIESSGIHFSPNNGRFVIELDRSIAHFWSYGTYNHTSTLTYHIVIAPRKPNDLGTFLLQQSQKQGAQLLLRIFLSDTAPHVLHTPFSYEDIKEWQDIHKFLVKVLVEEPKAQHLEFDMLHLIHTLKDLESVIH